MQAVGGTALSEDSTDRISSGDDHARPSHGSASRRVVGLLAAIAVAALVVDIITKVVVVANLRPGDPVRLLGGAVYLSLTRNQGAAFNIGGTGYTAILAAVAVVVIIVIIRFARRLRSWQWAVALGLVLGGAAGNLTDRLFRAPGPLRGGVVDFISVFSPDGHPWPIFNAADSCLVVGVIIAVLLELTGRRMDGTRAGRGTDDAKAVDDVQTGGTDQATTDQPGNDQATTDKAGTDRAGTEQTGIVPADTEQAGIVPADTEPAGRTDRSS
ncbi:signal peptidase II [Actinocatenispora sera]